MKLERHTILYRKDERGVIVESRVFGPDDDVPEGFGTEGYTAAGATTRTGGDVEIAESKLTPWDAKQAKTEADQEPSDALNAGSPLQARQQAGVDLTEAETEALEALEENSGESDEEADEDHQVNDGSPVQAKEEADVDLTEAEEKPGEESEKSTKASSRRSNRS